jgi:heptosyltransferase III
MGDSSKQIENQPSKTENSPGRILVIRGGAIGDFILTLPAIRLLRENFPATGIEILGYRQIITLAEGRYYAKAIRCIEYGPLAGFFHPRAPLDPELCSYFSGFQQVISYLYDPDELFSGCLRRAGVKNFLAASPKIGPGLHAARQLAAPLEQLALWLDDPAAQVYPSAADQAAADRLLADRTSPLLAIHPGSGGAQKNWPLDHWRQLMLSVAKDGIFHHLLLIGGECDGDRLNALRDLLPDRMTVLENLPLPVLAAVLGRCALFIGHDSGISHLAAAVGTRTLLIFGPTDPSVWAPANAETTILQAPGGDLSELEVESVLDKIPYAHVS